MLTASPEDLCDTPLEAADTAEAMGAEAGMQSPAALAQRDKVGGAAHAAHAAHARRDQSGGAAQAANGEDADAPAGQQQAAGCGMQTKAVPLENQDGRRHHTDNRH